MGWYGAKMESSVRDRFRLIYLKSAGAEKPALNETVPSPDFKESLNGDSSLYRDSKAQETFSSQTRLEQAKADLKHPDPKLRILAIQFLESVDPSVAFPLLQENLSDRNPEVRAQAILTLIKQRTPDVNPLLKKYLKDSSPKVKIAALRGIFLYGEGVDLNILLQLLSDESPRVRRKMATLLGWTQREGALPILAELSKDPDAKVRKAALFSLVTLYPEESEERLMRAMMDSEPNLRKWAKRALERMAEKPISIRGGIAPVSRRT
jgi:HEAT repeat protein